MGFQILFIIFFIMIWYLALIVETYSYLKKNNLGVNFLGIISIPFSLFTLHLKMFYKEKTFSKKLRYLAYYFINYKLSVIFLTELLLENIAMTEALGYSPYLSKKKANESKKTLLETAKDIIKLPKTTESFSEVLMAA